MLPAADICQEKRLAKVSNAGEESEGISILAPYMETIDSYRSKTKVHVQSALTPG